MMKTSCPRGSPGQCWGRLGAFMRGFDATWATSKLEVVLSHDGAILQHLGEYWGNLRVIFVGLGGY